MSKIFQSPSVSIETVKREIKAVADHLEEFREYSFNSAKTDAIEIAEKVKVEINWQDVRQRKSKRRFDYEGREKIISTPEEHLKIELFLYLVYLFGRCILSS